MRFSDIKGHERTISQLRHLADSGRVPHAILLSGIAGIGKMRLARAFAQYLACTHRQNGDSCGQCPACLQMQNFGFPDIYYTFPIIRRKSTKIDISTNYAPEWQKFLNEESYMPYDRWMLAIDAGKQQGTIYVTESEEIMRRAAMAPYASDRKIFLIWLPELFRPETANKLLKLIEEPYDDTIFLLVSNNPKEILPTIYSRTFRLDMLPLAESEVAEVLEHDFAIGREDAVAAARMSSGSVLAALDAMSRGSERGELLELFQRVMRAAYARRADELMPLAEAITDGGRNHSVQRLTYFAAMVRENYIYNLATPELNMLSASEEKFSVNFARFINDRNVTIISQALTDAINDIRRNANEKLVVFDTLLTIIQHIR